MEDRPRWRSHRVRRYAGRSGRHRRETGGRGATSSRAIIAGEESVRVILRCEARELRADARPQARKNRRRIRWNTVRIVSGRERRRCLQIVCRSRTASLGQTPRYFLCFFAGALADRTFAFGLAFGFAMAECDLAFSGARFSEDFSCLSFAESGFDGMVFLP